MSKQDHNTLQLSERVTEMLYITYTKSGHTMNDMSKLMGVSRTTIYNWTTGINYPNLIQTIKWFTVLKIPMIPWILNLFYDTTRVEPNEPEKEIENKLHHHVTMFTQSTKKKLLYIFSGEHGSAPAGIIEMIIAYLHLPLERRISICSTIILEYKLLRNSKHVDEPQPDIETIESSINKGILSVQNGIQSYTDTIE